MLSDDAKAMRKLSLMLSTLLALVLVLGIQITKFSVFGVDLTVDQRQLLILFILGNIYASSYFAILAIRDQKKWLQTYDLGLYNTQVADPAIKGYGEILEIIDKSQRLSTQGKQTLLWFFRLVRTANVMGRDIAKSFEKTYTEAEKAALEDALIKGELPPETNLNDATLVSLAEKQIYQVVNMLAPVEPIAAARIEAALYKIQTARSNYIFVSTDEALKRWHLSWSVAFLPIIAASMLVAVSVAAVIYPWLGPAIVDYLTIPTITQPVES